jgi:hypothetical protein
LSKAGKKVVDKTPLVPYTTLQEDKSMTYLEDKERREREEREKQERRQAAARERRLTELKELIEQAEAQWAEFTPEKVKGNSSMQAGQKKLEKYLDKLYSERDELQGKA